MNFIKLFTSGFKKEIVVGLSTLGIGMSIPLFCLNKKEDYYFLRDCLFSANENFRRIKQDNLLQNIDSMQQYEPKDLKNYFKNLIFNFTKLATFPIFYRQNRIEMIEKVREKNVKELVNYFNKVEKDLLIYNNSKETHKKQSNTTTKEEEDEVFNINVEKSKSFIYTPENLD